MPPRHTPLTPAPGPGRQPAAAVRTAALLLAAATLLGGGLAVALLPGQRAVLVAALVPSLAWASVAAALAAALHQSRAGVTRIAEAVDDCLYTGELLPDGSWRLVFLGGAERGERLLGGPPPAGATFADAWAAAVHRDDRPAFEDALRALRAAEPRALEYRLRGLDGRTRWVSDRGWPQRAGDGRVVVDGILVDVTERRRVDAELAEARANLDRIVESIDESLYTLGDDGRGGFRCVYAGPGWETILGGPPPAGADLYETWRARLHADDRPRFEHSAKRLLAGEPIEDAYRVVGLDGAERFILDRAKPRRLADGRLVVDGICIDITAQRRDADRLQAALAQSEALAGELARAAQVDALTGAATRRHLHRELVAAIQAAHDGGPTPGLLVLDVDHFKRINDSFGHGVGDEVLAAVGRRLRLAARDGDLVARLGGEEFCLLVRDVDDEEQLRGLAERVRGEVGQAPVFTHAGALSVTVSLGGAVHRPDARDGELMRAADLAMYSAKRRGRNRSRMAGDLTSDDLVAEEPEAIRLAQGLAWTASAHEGLAEHHCEQVADLSAAIAERLTLPAAQTLRVRLGGWLHDVGKVAVPDDILGKPAPLDAAEWDELRRHVLVGEQIVRRIDRLADAALAVRHHHERFDGRGYPDRLAGGSIPIEARIVAAADAYSAMTQNRAYSPARADGDAIAELRRMAGSQLDPDVVTALVSVLGDAPQVIELPRRHADRPRRRRRVHRAS